MDITSRKNERVLRLKKLGASRSFRREQGEFLCDGEKLLWEAVKWHAEICDVFLCGELSEELTLPGSARLYRVTREVLEAVSPLKTPQNVVFSVKIPRWERKNELSSALVLENMQDPGNVGTVIRTANAFGVRAVVLVGETADPYSAKAVRASMGAVFREPVFEMTVEELLERKTVPFYGAALSKGARDVRDVDLGNAAVAIGNEGSGLSEELLSRCDGTVIIPMNPACESLNAAAAAAVIAWEMARSNGRERNACRSSNTGSGFRGCAG